MATRGVQAAWTLCTPQGVGALAVIQIDGDVDAALASCGIRPVDVGSVVLRSFFGVDTGLVARYTDSCAHLMPHGGAAVVRAVIDGLTNARIPRTAGTGGAPSYPEARSDVETRALAALARAASPLAVDVLLSQHDRWRDGARRDPAMDRALAHLVRPALVVAVGRPNIGKSSLVNALAKRSVSIVADEPGTTRDHVGVRLNLAGLVVNYVDTPGLPDGWDRHDDSIESRAAAIAMELASRADLLLVCRDAAHGPPHLPGPVASRPSIHIGLRADLGATDPPDLWVSVKTGEGIEALVRRARQALVPDEALAWEGAWMFWGEENATAAAGH